MTDTRQEAHDESIHNIFPPLGETGNTRELIHMLAQRSSDK